MSADEFRLVVLTCPYDTWSDGLTRDLFGKIVLLKIRGYQKEYPYGILPADATDFIGTHVIIGRGSNENFVPMMGYKAVSLSRTNFHNVAFPALSLVKNVNAVDHISAMDLLIKDCNKSNLDLIYGGSMTIDPDLRGDEALVSKLWEMMMASHLNHDLANGFKRAITGAACRFKLQRVFSYMGYEQLKLDGKDLPPIAVPFANNEEVLLFYRKQLSPAAAALAAKYKYLWDQRLEIKSADSLNADKKAA